MIIYKAIRLLLAVLLIMIGPFTLISPIPGGSLVLPIGLAWLVYESPLAQRTLRRVRSYLPRFNQLMLWIENRVDRRIGDILKTTTPHPCTMSEVRD